MKYIAALTAPKGDQEDKKKRLTLKGATHKLKAEALRRFRIKHADDPVLEFQHEPHPPTTSRSVDLEKPINRSSGAEMGGGVEFGTGVEMLYVGEEKLSDQAIQDEGVVTDRSLTFVVSESEKNDKENDNDKNNMYNGNDLLDQQIKNSSDEKSDHNTGKKPAYKDNEFLKMKTDAEINEGENGEKEDNEKDKLAEETYSDGKNETGSKDTELGHKKMLKRRKLGQDIQGGWIKKGTVRRILYPSTIRRWIRGIINLRGKRKT